MISLTSDRLVLKPPSIEDDEEVAALRSDPNVRLYLEFLPEVCSVEDAQKRRESRAGDDRIVDFHIFLRQPPATNAKSLLGMTGLFDYNSVNQSAEIGIVVDPTAQRQGIATESIYMLLNYAFDTLHLHRVVFETARNNTPMRGWFEEFLGVQPEFHLKEAWKGHSGWIDAVGYRILDYEWHGAFKQIIESSMKSFQIST